MTAYEAYLRDKRERENKHGDMKEVYLKVEDGKVQRYDVIICTVEREVTIISLDSRNKATACAGKLNRFIFEDELVASAYVWDNKKGAKIYV